MDAIKRQVETDGYALVRYCVSEQTIRTLEAALDEDQHGIRNLLSSPTVRTFAGSDEVKRLIASVIGPQCFAVRGTYFNKNPKTNWKVTWHQDCVIAVRDRVKIESWGPWSRKAGVVHVRPPAAILQEMLAIRIHLDDCGTGNGPLRVVPGSHVHGILSDAQIQGWPKETAVTCTANRGEAILMRPLLLHASSPSERPSNRRVIHLEFAAFDLPCGAVWHDCV